MDSNLDQKFKDAFEQYELPYNESAWQSLNDKLDKIQVTNTPKSSSSVNLKWIGGAAVAAIAVISTIIYFQNNENKNNSKQVAVVLNQNESTSENTDKNTTGTVTESENRTNTSSVSPSIDSKSGNQTATENQRSSESLFSEDAKDTDRRTLSEKPSNVIVSKDTDRNNGNSNGNTQPVVDAPQEVKIKFPQYESVCEGEIISIPNKNSVDLTITSPNGKETIIQPGKTINYKASEAGAYTISSRKHTSNNSVFNARETPKVDFTINEELKYENGIPSIPVETSSEGSSFEWSFEGSSIKQQGTKASAHFYKKGTHEIILKSRNTTGCETSVSKTVTIEEDYNLLAPSGFMPLSDDPRKNRFIPIALTLRNTDFKLLIIEPRTGSVIFETNSIEGWNGVDRNTRQLVDENKSYAWKVILANPEPEERREYSGIVVRL